MQTRFRKNTLALKPEKKQKLQEKQKTYLVVEMFVDSMFKTEIRRL